MARIYVETTIAALRARLDALQAVHQVGIVVRGRFPVDAQGGSETGRCTAQHVWNRRYHQQESVTG